MQFDVTAAATVLPELGREFGIGIAGQAWVMDAYSLAFAGLLLAAGAVADRHGRRRALLAGNALFALVSLGCGLAETAPMLWAGRALQGAAGVFVITGCLASLSLCYPEPIARAKAFILLGVVTGGAMALGPTLGGTLASWLGWRSIFLVSLPACAAIAFVMPRLVPETREPAVLSMGLDSSSSQARSSRLSRRCCTARAARWHAWRPSSCRRCSASPSCADSAVRSGRCWTHP